MIDRAQEYSLLLERPRLLPSMRDGYDFEADFVVTENDGSRNDPARGHVRVGITGSLKAQWGIPDDRIEACLVRLAINYLAHRIKSGFLTREEELQLSTHNAPPHAPFDPVNEQVNYGPYAILT